MARARYASSRLAGGWLSRLALVVALLTGLQPAPAQPDPAALPLFTETEPLALTLELPLRALRGDTADSREERPGRLTLSVPEQAAASFDVGVRVRGRSRLAGCEFPPLRLNFARREVTDSVFAGQDHLKLVTLCRRQNNYRDYLSLEHDIYRLFSTLTDKSFRVRKVAVTYVGTDARRQTRFSEPAFLLEEDWEVAARHGVEVLTAARIAHGDLEPRHTALLAVFQFVVGNTDWSPVEAAGDDPCCHNSKVIGPAGAAIVLPYDFDQAGLIATEYAQPSPRLPIRSVRQRYYRGYCEMNAGIDAVVAHVLGSRPALERVLGESDASPRARARALAYLQASLDLLGDREAVQAQLVEACR